MIVIGLFLPISASQLLGTIHIDMKIIKNTIKNNIVFNIEYDPNITNANAAPNPKRLNLHHRILISSLFAKFVIFNAYFTYTNPNKFQCDYVYMYIKLRYFTFQNMTNFRLKLFS